MIDYLQYYKEFLDCIDLSNFLKIDPFCTKKNSYVKKT